MSILLIDNQGIYMDGYDLQGRTNAVAINYSANLLENTVLGQATRSRMGGLKAVKASANGFFSADATDLAMFADIGAGDFPVTFGASGDAYGDTSYFMNTDFASFDWGTKIGDLLPFSLNAESSNNALVRGTIMLQSRASALTATGAATAKQLGAVSSTQKLYGCLHVWQVGTGSITCVVESDSTNSFSGAQTTRLSFAAKSAIGSEFKSSNGAITDTWWRVKYTISGGAPSFLAICSLGIQ